MMVADKPQHYDLAVKHFSCSCFVIVTQEDAGGWGFEQTNHSAENASGETLRMKQNRGKC